MFVRQSRWNRIGPEVFACLKIRLKSWGCANQTCWNTQSWELLVVSATARIDRRHMIIRRIGRLILLFLQSLHFPSIHPRPMCSKTKQCESSIELVSTWIKCKLGQSSLAQIQSRGMESSNMQLYSWCKCQCDIYPLQITSAHSNYHIIRPFKLCLKFTNLRLCYAHIMW